RADRSWTPDLPAAARARLDRWRDATGRDAGPDATSTLTEVRAALADDLDTPGALAAVDRWAAAAGTRGGRDRGAPGLVGALVDALLGVQLCPAGPAARTGGPRVRVSRRAAGPASGSPPGRRSPCRWPGRRPGPRRSRPARWPPAGSGRRRGPRTRPAPGPPRPARPRR